MITGFGVHDRPDWPFTINGMRNDVFRFLCRLTAWRARSATPHADGGKRSSLPAPNADPDPPGTSSRTGSLRSRMLTRRRRVRLDIPISSRNFARDR